jgi:2-dehydro-3-deoxyphosphogluconate aldolase / (4S)-4-hydroxy-2-oxoglutarate aldolase
MTKKGFSKELFAKAPLIGIVRGLAFEEVTAVLPLYRDAGLTTVEITMNTAGAEDLIRYALEHYGADLNIGAGTVCTEKDLENALEAGAEFIVTPIVDEGVIRACVAHGVPIFPGAFTPSEIYKAWSLGATMVKLFPATSLGTQYLKDLKGPLPQIPLVPTGGVGLENLAHFLEAGAAVAGIGSQLFDKKRIKQQDWAGLEAHFDAFVQALSHAKPMK